MGTIGDPTPIAHSAWVGNELVLGFSFVLRLSALGSVIHALRLLKSCGVLGLAEFRARGLEVGV